MDLAADARVAAEPEESWYLDTAFTPGVTLGTRYDDPSTPVRVVEVREVTTIRIPSGRLVVDAPWPDEDESDLRARPGRELAERIPPGTHRVEAAWTEAPYDFMGERHDGRQVAAVRLLVAEAPVARWEMGLGVGDDIERIRPGGRRIGFRTETNTGSFGDAVAWPALTAPFLEFWRDARPGVRQPRRTENLFGGAFELVKDEERGADLVTFSAEGDDVVWLGRAESGAVVSVAVASGYHLFSREAPF
ncbi:DUF4241 domain-containing protein [Kitasatospora sp. NPDC059747]|uniref:DUF4241 domain-containing protein n=1 Tax=Kitasatospora sp. NPDC059747 TaxID=3346930 RepID=UPI00364785C6